ncbi:MAG: cytochrome [Alphaproteobacteria bacterium]|nr:cytochrome [Alphaproteobacteria bacterium]
MVEDPFLIAPRPDHVPEALARDFDIYALDGLGDDLHLAWKTVQDEMPSMFWTPRYRGHWVATRGEQLKELQENFQDFSHRELFIPRGIIPFQVPVQMDPPQHTPYRRLFMPAFLPRAVAEVEKKARATAIRIIDSLSDRGECEFVSEFAAAMPIQAFLTMMDLPDRDHAYLRGLAIYMSKPNHPDSPAAWVELGDYINRWIAERRARPGEDLISRIVEGQVEDRPLTEQEVFAICMLLLGGGLDTVVSMTSFAAHFLANNPRQQAQLRDNPKLIDNAIEEIARRFGTTNTSRLVTRDREFGGVFLKAGDIVVGPNPLYGLDERINEDPLTVDFERRRPRHIAFGNGPHTCPGAVLARREIRIFLEEWMQRMPEFHVKPGTHPKVTTGLVNAMGELWLNWTPPVSGEEDRAEAAAA